MANALAAKFREALLGADIDPLADNIKMVLVDATYTFSAAHDNLDDVGAGTRIATSGNLASKTGTDGYFDSASVTFSALPGGDTIVGFWLYKDSGVESTSKLIAWFDADGAASAISVATSGADVTVNPHASGWLRV